jgi:predicted nucleic acid-binding protein
MPDRYYLDTSVYVPMLLGEPAAVDIVRRISGAELLSSVLIVLEATRTLVRLSRQGHITPEEHASSMEQLAEDIEQFDLCAVSIDLCNSPIFPSVSLPRSFDLAHLRTAVMYHRQQPLTAFVSLDKPQLRAARELGLPT